MINTGIDEYALEPTLQGKEGVILARIIKLVDMFEEFHKSLVYYLLRFFRFIGVAIADLHGKRSQQVIQFLLAGPVVPDAALDQCLYLGILSEQNFSCLVGGCCYKLQILRVKCNTWLRFARLLLFQ